MSDLFTCECCGETFAKGRTDADADAEMRQRFSAEAIEAGPISIVCEECAALIYAWLRATVRRDPD